MNKSQIPNLKHGFTLVEVLVTGFLAVAVGAALVGLQYILTQNQLTVFSNYINVDEANFGITNLERELRSARSGDNGSYPLEIAGDWEIIFYSDIDYDGNAERVRYFLADSTLTKGIIEPTGFPITYPAGNEFVKIISENVRNGIEPVFYYYNSNWPLDTVNNPLAQPLRLSDTRLIGILLRLNSDSSGPDDDYILESTIAIRELKDNL
ncbi:hypothetical protein A3D84_00140 [Candidatus Woesebacteria bacterium RIFCSPHIGHO2_02_FULL_42_20]|uniref:Type II secretion system protein J n=1 Tax=Candidatus Woesebacteria bacterium RIFCSPHIGHO2_12_FULL_41_24 TaxID=1802510 RepID=A0A1F8ATM0_9BACT|nr:MAG: hypothetical protein A2W15_01640 [Candidatus Woesebacteria bacterium RBG_16_41_13]OGM28842.1 MAG: hypothetical protein A2873_05145 [Candidatus Woesebacteria bacterium RIFCSPHIGHO2_01_FULL_42_80]OGM35190.1 MAG: hypothetical protein A3D84_00140 [Candidatus Woesebacteria bacterium RIFCSPHIGHO2_02_FULL_42_20]OGM55084.1 MAG: hypothetical protein A3E44_04150 [Candidatus Woesebacteria bacterium RIFCSPHIGHO2_12_FULL_41_24]